ncbi:hypothetical protein NYP20_12075 [Pseudomonas sp. N3-W]|uniref:Uncharacterized protein n=1 Tax=Pseudomonas fungipugnans TaxID=3024217 RepID=A0ABT6QWT7_9PSED|nr:MULTISPECIES: hypothetical protein [unclassified Pseudomonas]MDI2595373.1 hypothetical protein [Pseudomonas sp. 681]UWF51653.1 hypothetical protein NYP20_12075 [Pseudomonas sp. N3-W]
MLDLPNLIIADGGFGLSVLQVTADVVTNALEALIARSATGFDITHQLDYSQLALYEDRLQAALNAHSVAHSSTTHLLSTPQNHINQFLLLTPAK